MNMLYDAYGRPIDYKALTREIATPSLAGIRTIWTNDIASGLTPARLARLLRAAADGDHRDYLTLAEEMEERNLHYAAELGKRKLAVSRLPITVEAYTDSAADKGLADAVRDMVRRPGMRGMIKNMLDGIAKGYSVVEILWDRSAEHWMPQFKWRDPHFFVFDRETLSTLRLLDDANIVEGIPLDPYKYIVHQPVIKSGIPIRNGLARLAAWAFMCSGYTVKNWLAFAEVFGMPLRMGKYNQNADKADIEILKLAVANLGTDAAAVFPDSMQIELVEAAKTGSSDFFKTLAEYFDNAVSIAVIGQTSSSGGTAGKLGEEKLQSQVRDDIRDDDAEQISDTLNRDLVRPFIDLNFGPQKNYPTVTLQAVKQEDIKTLGDVLAQLVPLGLEVEQSVIRDRIGLPDPAPGAKLLTSEQSLAPYEKMAANNRRHFIPGYTTDVNRAMTQGDASGDDGVDGLVDSALHDWVPIMEPLLSPITSLVEELAATGGTLQDLLAALADMYPQQDDEQMITALASAMFKTRAMGDATDVV